MARGDGGGRDGRGEPEWRPVSDVDMMTAVVLEQLGANREQLRTLEPARRAPHLLDDHTVERIKQVFGVQRDDLWLWVETGERWQAQELNAAEAAKVDQYVAAVEAFAASNTVILALADELAAGTIRRRWPSRTWSWAWRPWSGRWHGRRTRSRTRRWCRSATRSSRVMRMRNRGRGWRGWWWAWSLRASGRSW
ncbi:hypothetical protein AB0J28_12345 [Streptosporangium canum]|uniref:hypothetical protein n=1 Tax=Streptosporangium canum TaxID=324952 RepID=UPI00341A86BA